MFVCFVTGEREEKGKEKGKGKGKRKRKKNSINMFGHRETEKKEMWEFYISFVWFAKGRENKIDYFYLCALINDREIHILEQL